MIIKNRISEVRKLFNLTQEQLAEKVGTSKRMLSFIENEQRPLSLSTLYKIAEVFECSIDYLLYRSDYLNNDIKNSTIKEFEPIIVECLNNNIPSSQLMRFVNVLKDLVCKH